MLPSTSRYAFGHVAYCARCGHVYQACPHSNCQVTWDKNHAARIGLRYELGKRCNPDHDTATYTDPGWSKATE